jgi:Flp pilus assembly protein TadB
MAVLDAGIDAERAQRAIDGVGGLAAVLGLLAVAVAPHPTRIALLPVVVALSTGAWYAAGRIPLLLATAVRTRSLGTAPALVTRAAMRARVTPTAEAAGEFAAEGDGLLARRLAGHVHRARGTGHSGLESFADAWGDRFPALGRAVRLVVAATRAPEEERADALDRAREAILDGTRDRAADGAARLHGPVSAVYAFGVLLPLALVAILPAARVAGLPVSPLAVVVVYDVLLPLGLVAGGAWLLARRPVAFPPTRVPVSHPDVPDDATHAVGVGVAAAVAATLLARVLLPGWTPPIAAAGAGVGTGLVVRYRPVVEVRERARALEAGLPDALHAIGRRVANGESVEAALPAAARELDGPTGELLVAADTRARTFGVGVAAAFVGERGALADVPSVRATNVARLFAVAAREGRPAGSALVAMGDHLEELRAVERSARRDLERATATMRNTAGLFAPLVGGVTVALAGHVGGGQLGTPAVPPAALGSALGWYVLVLAVALTALATGLERGLDRALVGYRAGLAVLAATATYLAAVVAGGVVA